jgi:hypothetical protein
LYGNTALWPTDAILGCPGRHPSNKATDCRSRNFGREGRAKEQFHEKDPIGILHTHAGDGSSSRANQWGSRKYRNSRWHNSPGRGCDSGYAIGYPDYAVSYTDHPITHNRDAHHDRSDTFTDNNDDSKPIDNYDSQSVHDHKPKYIHCNNSEPVKYGSERNYGDHYWNLCPEQYFDHGNKHDGNQQHG